MASLSTYKKKRDFKSTPEPTGGKPTSSRKLSFVVQRHKASHLHYDFRLEVDGVLKSWAIPKGPSLNPGDKRLAMMVEDHPYDYKDFKGIIPDGYGAGIVEIWDKGWYTYLGEKDAAITQKEMRKALKAGSIKVVLHGKKLKGEFALVKIKSRQAGDKDNTWLLIKHNDKYAVEGSYDSEKLTAANSPINKALAQKDEPPKKKRLFQKSRKVSSAIKPMLAKETDKAFDDEDWLFEIKWDGYRAIAEVGKKDVKLYSRNANDFLAAYPVLQEALQQITVDAILDGEIVVVDENGQADFQNLQHYDEHIHNLHYYVFDLLQVNGKDITDLPITDRKELLKTLIPQSKILKYADHIKEKGIAFFDAVSAKNLEGIIAKKADSRYAPGVRSKNWLKIKNHKSDEAFIVGYTKPTGNRKNFGALVLAFKTPQGLKYAGHTGTGFNDEQLESVYNLLSPLHTKTCPFADKVKTNMPVTWVKPSYVAEIKFTEKTADGKMRHPVFLRMRPDKNVKSLEIKKPETNMSSNEKKKKQTTASIKKNGVEEESFGGKKVKITHRDKIYFPDDEITKGDVIDYYQTMSNYILPYLKGRPQSLNRHPGGIAAKGFYHKDAGENVPDFVKTVVVESESSNKDIDYIICDNKATLAYLNNLGCIEINPWNSQVKNLSKPDYLIIDIDPSEKNSFEQVIEAALAFKKILDKAGAKCFCKTSGSTGLHIFVPMAKKYDYKTVQDFAQLLCTMVQETLPEFTTLERNLKKRGTKHMYLDYLQNREGQTLACAYSLRPKKGATVSAPLEWKEVKKGLTPQKFTLHNIFKRVKAKGDLFKGVLGTGVNIEACLKKLDA